MIHEFIFCVPKPGMPVEDFHDYWVRVHAVEYVARIHQIRQYVVDTRVPFDGDLGDPPLPHQGIAELWLDNEEEHMAALRSDEFLQGARADEPRWAAFWQTIFLDTVAHEIVPGAPDGGGVKMTTLIKRRPGLALAEYREATLDGYGQAVGGIPGLRRYLHCHADDWAYTFGEAPFDSIEQIWFDDLDALRAGLASRYHAERVRPARQAIADPRLVFSLTAREHWIIGPIGP